ncbi:hypothetical protein A3C89_02730 [Candidatus Kaiserbacteria bacterium RIFCSPHIGHO2_02_FULL_50_50]|uniref:Uncharacterized protein n=1 Tax=Candidatus Kaiserbacteria bacterium RIFCSPHIGHO2_02_FULL_50_50 TaxID=1798492 RepID=A0A1F6DDJ4_9BACT|nr:MAG: hypothetical protein A3C89_02730 [Candidatus Kaiserbacteria bacterium RIFCSPHIGHO2_02_FULL_50_50]OGG89154.1 MAG: hypothetical protein A3G62_00200 [Candidatus Kaiserbacteria bacterium RIFCSPLOWO2_12_FULL_50_10]
MQDDTTNPITDLVDDSDEELDFAQEAGMVILESAITRFVLEADDEEVQALETILSAHDIATDALPKLVENIPRFADILSEEMEGFQKQADEIV